MAVLDPPPPPVSELQSQLLVVESEMSSKNKEIQTLHSSLTDTMVSKEQLEHKVLELLEVSQHSRPDDSQQLQVPAPCFLFLLFFPLGVDFSKSGLLVQSYLQNTLHRIRLVEQ